VPQMMKLKTAWQGVPVRQNFLHFFQEWFPLTFRKIRPSDKAPITVAKYPRHVTLGEHFLLMVA